MSPIQASRERLIGKALNPYVAFQETQVDIWLFRIFSKGHEIREIQTTDLGGKAGINF